MAFVIKDRVKEITTSTGTGAVSLGTSSATFDTFQSCMTNGDTTYYAIVHTSSGVDEWEVGLGTFNTNNTLSRTTVLTGSSSTSTVNFSTGSKDIFMTYPAAQAALKGYDVNFADISATGLTVDGTDTEVLITEDSEGSATLRFADTQADPAQSYAIEYDTSSNKANFKINNTQRANFNAQGDYMVGPATTDNPFVIYNGNNDATKAGVGLRQTGYIGVARMNDHAMMLNRMGSDGLTMGLRNDGTFVGGFGNFGGELTFHDSTTAEAMRLDSSGNLGIGTTNPSTTLDVDGTVTATAYAGDGSGLTNIARKVWESSQGSGSSANYWAKVATYSITGDFDDGVFIYHFMPEELGAGMPAIIAVNVRTNNASGGDSHTLNVELMSKPHATPFSDDSFKLIDNGGSSDIELWVKKNDNNCQISAYEMSAHVENSGFTIAYNQNAAWQASEPTGSGLNIKTVGVKVAGNFNVTGSIAVSGTVDGRDVAADGTKLDGIEASATADQTKADIDALNVNADTLDGQHGAYYTGYTDTAVANLVDSSPGTLNTLNELAAALGDDPNFATTTATNIGTKLSTAGGAMTGAITTNSTFDGRDVAVDGTKLDGLDQGVATTDSPTFTGLDVIGGDKDAVSILTDGHVQLYDNTSPSRSYTFLSRDAGDSMVGGNMRLDASVTTGSHIGYSNGTDARGGSGIFFDNTTSGSSAYGEIKFLQSNDTNDDTWVVREAMHIDTTGNVGIGTSNPSQLLHLSKSGIAGMRIEDTDVAGGYVDLEVNGSAFFIDSHDEDGTEGLVVFRTAGTETMRIDGSGNVGIGTGSPQEKVHVIGSAKLDFGSAGGNPRLYFDHDTVTDDANYIQLNRGDAGLEIVSEDNLKFDTNGSEAMRIDSSGNVGIGTGSPSGTLQISNTFPTITLDETNTDAAYQQTQLAIDDGSFRIQTRTSTNAFVSNDYLIDKDSSGATDHIWRISNSEALRIDSSGSVGIGTSSPSEALTVNGNGVFGDATTKYNRITINGGHVVDGDNDYGLTINSFEPAITLLDRSTGAGSGQMRVQSDGSFWFLADTTNNGTIGHTANTTDSVIAKLQADGTVTATAFAGDGSALTGVLSKGADIGGSVDLNTYTTDGYYHQNQNANAISGTNYPVANAGMLTVMADGNMVYQKYQTYNGSGTYQRTQYNSTWYAWDKILDSGNLTTTGTVTATAFAGDGSALTGISAAVKGFITFNGSTGAVINSSNLTLSKTATGSYTITLASGIQIGSANYTAIIGNVDDKRTSAAQQVGTLNNNKVSNYNAWVNTRTNTNFTVSATRTNHSNLHFGGNDNNSGTAFGLALVDPVEISIAVLD